MADAAASPRVLVVEDDPSVSRVLTLQLERRGYQVETAPNGAQGYETLQRSLPDCVILDLMMPVMDGFELLKRIRSLARSASIPVVILTASEDDRHRMRGRQYQADYYLNKPFDIDELDLTIRRLVDAPARA